MSNFDYTNLTTRELLEKAMNGEIPIPRNNPKFGESKYFFMKMGSDPYSSINDAETFDVPDGIDPFEFRDNGYSAPLTSSLDTSLTDSGDSWLDSSDSNLQNGMFSPTPENWNDTIVSPTIPANGKALSSYYGNSIANNKPSLLETAFSRLHPVTEMNENFSNGILSTQIANQLNTYMTPQKKSDDLNWGEGTAQKLNDYLSNEYPLEKKHSGIFGPFKDFYQNYQKMKDMKLLESDNFFHCKANYEAAKQGLWGEIVAKIISLSREVWGLAGGDPLSDSMRDWNANQMGWDGAKEGLNLQEACPTDPKVYYNPKWYQKF